MKVLENSIVISPSICNKFRVELHDTLDDMPETIYKGSCLFDVAEAVHWARACHPTWRVFLEDHGWYGGTRFELPCGDDGNGIDRTQLLESEWIGLHALI